MNDLYDTPLTRIDGSQTSLAEYRNKDQGFVVLGFPCNQFGAQEPGDDTQISEFCETNYGVSFPMFAKVDVNGPNTHPLFIALKKEAKGILGSEAIKWNFTKFLVSRDGAIVNRYAPLTSPEEIENELATLVSN